MEPMCWRRYEMSEVLRMRSTAKRSDSVTVDLLTDLDQTATRGSSRPCRWALSRN